MERNPRQQRLNDCSAMMKLFCWYHMHATPFVDMSWCALCTHKTSRCWKSLELFYTSYFFYSVLSYKNPARVCDVSDHFTCKGKQNKTCVYTTDCRVYCDENYAFIQSVRLFVVGFSHCTRCADVPCSFDIYSGVISNSLFTSEVFDILFELCVF